MMNDKSFSGSLNAVMFGGRLECLSLLFSVSQFACRLARCLCQSVCQSRPCRARMPHPHEAAARVSYACRSAAPRDRRSSRILCTRVLFRGAVACQNHRARGGGGAHLNSAAGRAESWRQPPAAAALELSLKQLTYLKSRSAGRSSGKLFCALYYLHLSR